MVETITKKKKQKKHSQQTITHYDSDITCPEISSDDEQAGHSANQSKTLPDIYLYLSLLCAEAYIMGVWWVLTP